VGGTTASRTSRTQIVREAFAYDANDLDRVCIISDLCATTVGAHVRSGRGDVEEWESWGTGWDIARYLGRHSYVAVNGASVVGITMGLSGLLGLRKIGGSRTDIDTPFCLCLPLMLIHLK
jgi:hypothetical protein